MSCEFCKEPFPIIESVRMGIGFYLTKTLLDFKDPISGVEEPFTYDYKWLRIEYPGYDRDYLPIKYCPLCGEYLIKGEPF